MAVAASLFFAACGDDSSPSASIPGLSQDESSSSTEIVYSTDSEGNQVIVSVPSSSPSTEGNQNTDSGNVPNSNSSSDSGSNPGPNSVTPAPEITDAPAVGSGKVNFPFPQESDYGGRATLLSNKSAASAQLKSAFAAWMKDMYNESENLAGIRSNPGSDEYFSEGIGYGMILMVYFSDNTTSYQPQFDKLWNTYKKFDDGNGLMHWKIGKLTEVWDKGAALDGDIDAAAALIMAAYQFGDQKYLAEAKTLIQAMKNYEFEASGQHLPGDSWGAGVTRRNPGYFDPAYMPLFAAVDKDNATFWSVTAYDANMKLYESSANESNNKTGLIDDWTNNYGVSEDDYYSYDASRAPWRNAKAVCWHGDARALAIDAKIAKWASGVSANSLSGPIVRSTGSLGNDHNSTFIATIMTSFISGATYQSNLDSYWTEAVNLGNENYFNQSLKLLNGLLVSGNMPNLMALAAGQK